MSLLESNRPRAGSRERAGVWETLGPGWTESAQAEKGEIENDNFSGLAVFLQGMDVQSLPAPNLTRNV